MLFPRFFSRSQQPQQNPKEAVFGTLVNTSDDTLLVISANRPAVLLLYESTMDVEFMAHVSPSRLTLEVAASDPKTFPEWSWDFAKKEFKRTKPELIDDTKRSACELAAKKIEAFGTVMHWINRFRGRVYTGFNFQEAIYAKKEAQARMLREHNYADESAHEAPYVTQYAEVRGISLQAAADEIIFQAQQDADVFLRSEKTRLELLSNIRTSKTVEEVDAVLGGYMRTVNV